VTGASWSRYVEHLRAGGAPFGGEWNATIEEVVAGYREALRRERAERGRVR
jgi:hypothetical protein